jgi:hypothetical protein
MRRAPYDSRRDDALHLERSSLFIVLCVLLSACVSGMCASEVGDRDDCSTFYLECKELAYIIKNAHARALVLVNDTNMKRK